MTGPRWRLCNWSNKPPEPVIRLHQVSFTYHPGEDTEHLALADIDLVVHRGEFVAIVGANGSGKSTLAKLLNGLLLPTKGSVQIAGLDTSDPTNIWEIRRRVGMVFQNPDNQLVATTVEEDVAFGPENLGLPPAEINERIAYALSTVDMAVYRTSLVERLSGGQKQRVAIAGILAMRPEVIVMDEPTAMLDPLGRKQVLGTILSLRRQSRITIVYITHLLEEAIIADRVVVLANGKIATSGTPARLFARPDFLQSVGVGIPPLVELCSRLRTYGLDIPFDIQTVDDLVTVLCQLRSKT